jgi:hypothetical protein
VMIPKRGRKRSTPMRVSMCLTVTGVRPMHPAREEPWPLPSG